MFRLIRTLASGLAILCSSALAVDEPAASQPSAPPLSAEEMAGAARIDALSIPTPGELLAALDKVGKIDWISKFRPPIARDFSSRPQMALNLGGLIADGYIAVEAKDSQQVKNLGRDIVALAKPLGVQQDIINRGKSLTEFATDNQWDTLKEELEATQNEVKDAMIENKDINLVTLVTVGGWLRGAESISSYVAEEKFYSSAGAMLLRQPGIVGFLSRRLGALPEKTRDDPVVKKTRAKLAEIETAMTFPRESPPAREAVEKLSNMLSDLLKDISRKEVK